MTDDLRQRYAAALETPRELGAHETFATIRDAALFAAGAVLAVRDTEMEQLRYERRLLGAARMVLDLVAAGDSSRWEQARREAEDIAQRITDEIGHPVTDEPALGPGYRATIARVRTLAERWAALTPPNDWGPDVPYGVADAGRAVLAALAEPEADHG